MPVTHRTGLRAAVSMIALVTGVGAMGGVAQAQVLPGPPPTDYTVDGRGVDVRTGSFNHVATDVSIGDPGQGGLAYSRVFTRGGWRDNVTGTVVAPGTLGVRYTVSVGGSSEVFMYSLEYETWEPERNTGSTLEQAGLGVLVYTRADGSSFVFEQRSVLPAPYNPAGGTNAWRMVAAGQPDGRYIRYEYEDAVVGSVRWTRLATVSDNQGYRLNFAYQLNNPSNVSQQAAWFRLDKVTAINRAVDYCSPQPCSYGRDVPTATYSYPSATSYQVTDVVGRTTRYDWDANGLGYISLPGDATADIVVTYGTGGRVSEVSTPDGAWTYAYADASGIRTTTITDPLSNVSTARTDISTDPETGLPYNQLTRWTTATGNATNYTYAGGRLASITFPEGNSVEYERDLRGNVTRTTVSPKPGSGLTDIVTEATYTLGCADVRTCNLPTSTEDANGNVTTYTYAAHGGLETVTSPAVAVPGSGTPVQPQTRITYAQRKAWYMNDAGVLVEDPMTAGVFLPIEVSACVTTASCDGTADEVLTTITYGSSGVANNLLPTVTTSGSGAVPAMASTTMTWTPNGDVATVDGPLAGTADTTRYLYDAGRRPIGVIAPDPDGAGARVNAAQRNTYDSYDNLIRVETGTTAGQDDTAWAGFTPAYRTETTYDAALRPVTTRLMTGVSATAELTQISYDGMGRVECVTQRMNPSIYASLPGSACTAGTAGVYGPDRITRTTYDAASRPLSTSVDLNPNGAADLVTQSVTYTANGFTASMTDGAGNRSAVEYDGFDRPVRLLYPNPTGGGTSTTDWTQYGWDANGNMTAWHNRAGYATAITYDALNRPTAVNAPLTTMDLAYTYDLLGRTLSLTSTGGGAPQTVTRTYDALSNLTSEAGPLGTMGYSHDAAGNVTRITWPDAYYTDYDHNPLSQVTAIRENGATSGSGVVRTYVYDDLGRLYYALHGNGTMNVRYYDAYGRWSAYRYDLAGAADDMRIDFTRNPAGQITARANSNTVYGPASQTFAYDALGRLTGANVGAATTWTLDDATNWNTRTTGGTPTTYSVNGRNQLTAVGATAITSDNNFNLSSGLGVNYTHDQAGRLTAADSTTLTYDAASRLYGVGTGTRFLYAGPQMAGEYDAADNLTVRYIPGVGINETVLSRGATAASRRWPLVDERGSVFAQTEGNSILAGVVEYDSYGQSNITGGGPLARFGYTGQPWIAEAGAYHYRARNYLSQVGRFMETDPIGYAGGANLYAYVGADPMNAVDPTGTHPLLLAMGVGAVIGGGVEVWRQYQDHGSVVSLAQVAGQAGVGAGSALFGGGVGIAVARVITAPIVTGVIGGAAGGALGSGTSAGLAEYSRGGNPSEIIQAAVSGGRNGAILGGAGGGLAGRMGVTEFARSPYPTYEIVTRISGRSAGIGAYVGELGSSLIGSSESLAPIWVNVWRRGENFHSRRVNREVFIQIICDGNARTGEVYNCRVVGGRRT